MSKMFDENPLLVIEAHLTSKMEYAQSKLESFKQDLANDPLHAFGWSYDAFQAAAEFWCCKDMLGGLKAKKSDGSDMYQNTVEGTVAFLCEAERVLMEIALREIRYPSHSTHVQHNEAEREKASAAFKLAENAKEWRIDLLRTQFINAAKAKIAPHQVFTHYGVTYRAMRKSPASRYYITTADDALVADHLPSLDSAIDFARSRAAQHEYEIAKQNGRINAHG